MAKAAVDRGARTGSQFRSRGACVGGLRLPIWADHRNSLDTASSRGGGTRPPKATATGDESSASVRAPRLSTPRNPGKNGDGAHADTEVLGAHRLRGERPIQIVRAENEMRRSKGWRTPRNVSRETPAGASPTPHQQSEMGENGPQTQPRRDTGARISYLAMGIADIRRLGVRLYDWSSYQLGARIATAAMRGVVWAALARQAAGSAGRCQPVPGAQRRPPPTCERPRSPAKHLRGRNSSYEATAAISGGSKEAGRLCNGRVSTSMADASPPRLVGR